MSESRRTNITISESLYAKAQEMMKLRDFSDFSGYLQQLIREDWERRMTVGLPPFRGGHELNAPSTEEVPPRPVRPVTYKKTKK